MGCITTAHWRPSECHQPVGPGKWKLPRGDLSDCGRAIPALAPWQEQDIHRWRFNGNIHMAMRSHRLRKLPGASSDTTL